MRIDTVIIDTKVFIDIVHGFVIKVCQKNKVIWFLFLDIDRLSCERFERDTISFLILLSAVLYTCINRRPIFF